MYYACQSFATMKPPRYIYNFPGSGIEGIREYSEFLLHSHTAQDTQTLPVLDEHREGLFFR